MVDDNFGVTPLIMAIEYSRDARGQKVETEIVKELIKAGADVNTVDEKEQSPLLHAIYRKNTAAAKVLLDHVATFDMSTVEEAREHSPTEIYELMKVKAMPAAERSAAEMLEEETRALPQ